MKTVLLLLLIFIVWASADRPCPFQSVCRCDSNEEPSVPGGMVNYTMVGCQLYTKAWLQLNQDDISTKELYMIGNYTDIPDRAFQNFTSVTDLQLFRMDNEVIKPIHIAPTAFEPYLVDTINSVTMQMHFSPLDGIPTAMRTLTNLQTISITRARLNALKDFSFAEKNVQLPKVKMIVVANCELNSVDPLAFYAQESSLQTLDMSFNNLQFYPAAALNQLNALNQLSLSNNPLKTLPAFAFKSNAYLQILNLNSTSLGNLPEEAFSGLESSLMWLDLGNNRINRLPESIYKLRGVQTLNLHNNQITSMKNLSTLVSLGSFNLEHNPLTGPLAPGLFSGLNYLASLSLSYTQMTSLNLEILRGSRLSTLKVRGNAQLKSVSLENVADIPQSVVALNFSDNPKLESFSPLLQDVMLQRPLLVLDMSNTPSFYCHCDLEWLNEVLEVNPTRIRMEGTVCGNRPKVSLAQFLRDLRAGICYKELYTTTQKPNLKKSNGQSAVITNFFNIVFILATIALLR